MKITALNPKLLPIIGIGLACIFWLIDALLDVYLFNNALSFFESFFTSDPNELWMRFSVVITIIIFSFYAKMFEETKSILEKENGTIIEIDDELEYLETTDPLTLLFNKRKFYELLEYEMEKEKRYKMGLSIIFCSIDNYNKIYDTYDRQITDGLFRNVASQLVKSLRSSDTIARWGEDEFIIIIPNNTKEETRKIAEKIRKIIECYTFDDVGNITASFGVTQFIDDDNKVTIVKRAINALNMTQKKGANHIES
jgi:diguanylate cyclase (GGDEF)-like protein